MSAEDIREQTTPYFRIPDVPPELTIAERLHDIFWASYELIYFLFFRSFIPDFPSLLPPS